MTSATIRPFSDQDYPAFVAVWNAVFEDYAISGRFARHEDSRYDGDRLLLRRFVAEAGGGVVGTAEFHHVTYMYHPQKFWLDVRVRPEYQRRGIGGALYARLVGDLTPHEPKTLWTSVRETFASSNAFVKNRGFREVRRAWESRLAVAQFDPAPFQPKADAAAGGLMITTAAAEQARDPQWLEKLYDLHNEVASDVPQPEPYTSMSLAQFRRRWFDNPEYLPDGHFLAKDGARYVGESNLFLTEDPPDVLYQGITGTRRDYRSRGLALALKLRTIEYARTHGRREIRTWNDTLNAPMLAINVKLGFVRQPAWITYEKSLDDDEGGTA